VTGEGLLFGDWLIPEAELEERFDTYGGPGGQHANKSETAVTLRFAIDDSSLPEDVRVKLSARLGPEVEVTVSETRSQWRNRQIARDRLREWLEAALVDPKPRRKSKPSKAARGQRLTEKKARSELKRSRRRPEGDD
jgi:ribosome-associated protein